MLMRNINLKPTCSITVFSHHWGPMRVMAAMILAWSTPRAQSYRQQRSMAEHGCANRVTQYLYNNKPLKRQSLRQGRERETHYRSTVIPAKGRRGVSDPEVPWVEPQWPVQTAGPIAAGWLQRPAELQPGSSESAQTKLTQLTLILQQIKGTGW